MKNILVTGGFGFIGSHLIERLLEEKDNHVHVVDNLSSSPLPLEFLLEELGKPKNLSYTIASVNDFCTKPDVDTSVFSEIYHLASIVGPAGVIPRAGEIAHEIVSDSFLLTKMALKNDAKLLDVSTSEIYGGGQEGLCSEEMPRIVKAKHSARLEYSAGKLAAEIALLNTADVKGVHAKIVRPFNVAGPRQSGKGGFVLARFVAQAISGKPLTIFGDGTALRAFTHVEDIVDSIVLTMDKGKDGNVYNIGNPANKCSINELAETVLACVKGAGKVYVDPKTIYGSFFEEANDKFPDASRAMNELGWKPKFDRKRVVEDAVAYFKGLPKDMQEHLGALEA
ncbi:MAG: NAD-dependent epimerase/dehydratase family protein [bacterium]|nr:NAD-dependent epimerase/dehydratase family protein [bacterium]